MDPSGSAPPGWYADPGDPAVDFGLTVKAPDIGPGFLASIVAGIASAVVLAPWTGQPTGSVI